MHDFHEKVTNEKILELATNGHLLYGATVQAGLAMFVPAGWIVYTRVLAGTGDDNSTAGVRYSFFPQDAKALASLQSVKNDR